MIKKVAITLISFILLFFLLLFILEGRVNRFEEYKGRIVPGHGNTVSIILIDGLSSEVFRIELASGKLPNLQALISSGIYVENGIGSFPSMTGYAFYPFLTGLDAPGSGIAGLRWFDRNASHGNLRNYVGRSNIQMNRDINNDFKLLYELVDSQYTSSINTYLNRGAQHSQMTGWQHTTSKYFHVPLFRALRKVPYFGERIVKDFLGNEEVTIELAMKQLKNNPKIQWITLPSLDAMSHIHGMGPEYVNLLHQVDGLIGTFIKEVDRQNQSDSRGIVIISDHGVSDVNRNVDYAESFEANLGLLIERGKSVELLNNKLTKPLEKLDEIDGYFVINGNLSAYLYLRDPDANEHSELWGEKLYYQKLRQYPIDQESEDILDFVKNLEGVELSACAVNDSMIFIQTSESEAFITKRLNKYSYMPVIGDPLEYYDQAEIREKLEMQKYLSNQEWLSLTTETKYPYAVPRLFELLSIKESGDIVLCSGPGYDFAADYELFVGNYKGGHGGLRQELISVPYIMTLPSVPDTLLPIARSEDVGATILDFLDISTDYSLDGNSLIND